MAERRRWPWPAWVLALDIVGTLFLVAGLLGLFFEGDPGQESALAMMAIPLIVLGVLLMIPLIVFTVLHVRSSR